MSQKEFSERNGIAQSGISDWKRKWTNPVSEKILIICEVLEVTPYELLAGTDGVGSRSNPSDVLLIDKNSEYGRVLMELLVWMRSWRVAFLVTRRHYLICKGKTYKSLSRDRKVPKFKQKDSHKRYNWKIRYSRIRSNQRLMIRLSCGGMLWRRTSHKDNPVIWKSAKHKFDNKMATGCWRRRISLHLQNENTFEIMIDIEDLWR